MSTNHTFCDKTKAQNERKERRQTSLLSNQFRCIPSNTRDRISVAFRNVLLEDHVMNLKNSAEESRAETQVVLVSDVISPMYSDKLWESIRVCLA